MSYVDEVLELVKKKNASEPEFIQAVTEVLNSLRPVVEANEELYKKNAILERITEPDRQIMFRVPWVAMWSLSAGKNQRICAMPVRMRSGTHTCIMKI